MDIFNTTYYQLIYESEVESNISKLNKLDPNDIEDAKKLLNSDLIIKLAKESRYS